jgi:hypothetical protein
MFTNLQCNMSAFLRPCWAWTSSARRNLVWERPPYLCLPLFISSSLLRVKCTFLYCATLVSWHSKSRGSTRDSPSTFLTSSLECFTAVRIRHRHMRMHTGGGRGCGEVGHMYSHGLFACAQLVMRHKLGGWIAD